MLVPIDKAANNVGLICKKYFLEILRKETTTETYEEYDNTAEEVIGAIRKISSNIGIPVEKMFNDLPLIHATIKMHNNLIKFRFIIGSRTGVIKPAAKKLVQILKLVMKTHRRYCDKIKFYIGIERNWIIENNQKILQNSFAYTSGHCRRWRSRMEVKIMAGSLFVHCKIAYFYSVTAEKWLIVSLPNFVTIRRTHFSISCKIFSWIRSTKLKIHAMEFCDFI